MFKLQCRIALPKVAAICLTLCTAHLFLPVAHAQTDLTELTKAPSFKLESGDLMLRFQPSRAWTFDEIRWKGQLLTNPSSQSGLVLSTGPGKFWGGSHNEGGLEKVLSVSLAIEGKPADHMAGGVFRGRNIELTKKTQLADAQVQSIIRLKDGILECEQALTMQQEMSIDQVYAFMFPWTTHTKHWLSKTVNDVTREGDFGGTAQNWELRDDVQWSSVYNPENNVAALTLFSPNSQKGQGIKHAYWVRPGVWNTGGVYHKQYYQPLHKITLPKDSTYHWKVRVTFLSVAADQWKEAVQEAAKSLMTAS